MKWNPKSFCSDENGLTNSLAGCEKNNVNRLEHQNYYFGTIATFTNYIIWTSWRNIRHAVIFYNNASYHAWNLSRNLLQHRGTSSANVHHFYNHSTWPWFNHVTARCLNNIIIQGDPLVLSTFRNCPGRVRRPPRAQKSGSFEGSIIWATGQQCRTSDGGPWNKNNGWYQLARWL
jgi:hypothetical protein